MRCYVLGPFEIHDKDRDLTPRTPRLRELAALLVARHNHVVLVDELIEEFWGQDPPATAVSTLQTYIYRLRRLFVGRKPTENGGMLHTKFDGYVLKIPPEDIDLHHFTGLSGQGRTALNKGDARAASRLCRQALRLWRGPPFTGVLAGERLSAHVTRLEEVRLRALETAIEADLRLGQHTELIGELKELAITHPLHEGFYGQLMLALHHANRRGEALSTYQRLRRSLIDELGLEPSARLRELHQWLLTSDPTARSAPGEASVVTLAASPGTPAQLPPDIADFTGRDLPLRTAVGHLTPNDDTETAIRLLAINGMPGIGKTALAVRVAHRLRPCYPDGQFYVDLHGSVSSPANPSDVLGRFLRATGIDVNQSPADLDERATLFRTWTADRRVLVVLDDAASTKQIGPLLPGGAHCGVVTTSRWRLPGLPSAHHIELGPLTMSEGCALLGAIVGHRRLAAEPAAAERIVGLCGHLPLAIRGVAERMLAHDGWPLDQLVRRLRPESTRFDEMRFGECDLRARLDSAYRALEPPVRRVFTNLAMLDQPTFTTRGAASALDCDIGTCEDLLDRLVECHLLHITGQQPEMDTRYGFHSLVRLYDRERLMSRPDPPRPAA